jgi:hypothetical protein
LLPRRSIFRVAFWFVIVCICLVAKLHPGQVQSEQPQIFGRYKARDVMGKMIPVIHALLPNRNDLSLTAVYGEAMTAQRKMYRVWNVDCTDSQGNGLVHVVCDADSGRICWMGNAVGGKDASDDLTPPRPIALSSQMAAASAQRWMQRLGFQETWKMQGVPTQRFGKVEYSEVRWLVTLEQPGWRARLSLDVRTGALMYATILATR